MTKISKILKTATDKSKFISLNDFLDFTEMLLEYTAKNLQAVIISQNENHYQFFQYGKEGSFQISRPLNSNLIYKIDEFLKIKKEFFNLLQNAKDIPLEKKKYY
jgi:hypothetical protein